MLLASEVEVAESPGWRQRLQQGEEEEGVVVVAGEPRLLGRGSRQQV